MSKTCPELLREAANLIEEALSRTPPAPAAPSTFGFKADQSSGLD